MKRFPIPSIDSVVFTVILAVQASASGGDGDWPHWRGPNNTGYAADANPPVEFSDTHNVRWKTEIPGAGHATPIVHDGRVYLMTAVGTDMMVPPDRLPPEDPNRDARLPQRPTRIYAYQVIALDRHTGAIVWRTTVREELPHEGGHRTNTFSSASIVTDGQHLIANFGSRGLYALDLEGTILWDVDLGDMTTRNNWGEGATPALHDGTLVVPWDHEGRSFVIAYDVATGEQKWRKPRAEATTWASPAIVEVGGRTQAILAGNDNCISYDLETGAEIWRCKGLTVNTIPTPILGHGMVYLMSGYRGNMLMAVKLDQAKGDITGTDAVAWTHERGTSYVPSAMLSGRNIYFLGSNNGILSCLDAVTGEPHYVGQRLPTVRNVFSSIVGANGHLYICGREGNVAVVRDGPEFEVVVTNSMGQGINASLAIVDDEIFLRGDTHLFCIGSDE